MECQIYTESLTALMDGELAPDEAATIRQHLVICRGCNAEYESLSYSYELVDGLTQLDSQPGAWRAIEDRLRTPEKKRGFIRDFFFPNLWVPVSALGTLVLFAVFILWFVPSPDRSEEMQQVLRNYIQQRDHELTRTGVRIASGTQDVRMVQYNPFSEPESKPKGNPFKVE